jgi:protein phosphatase
LGTAVIHFTAAAISDRGRKRPSNEDAFGYSVENGVYVVCDGMGGAAAGEIASSLAVDEVMKLLTNRDGAISLPNDAEQAVAAANQAIFARAERSNKLSGMGTTMVALLAQDRRVWMVNVGDSRGYQMRNGHLQQITVIIPSSRNRCAWAAWTRRKLCVRRCAT